LGLLEQRTGPGSSEKQCLFAGSAAKAAASVDGLDASTGDRYICLNITEVATNGH
jgi:hypothetical protein